MVVLLDCLKRRENWPEQFIAALEACEHSTLAAEIRAEYNALRVIHSKSFSQVPSTVNYCVELNVLFCYILNINIYHHLKLVVSKSFSGSL